MIPRATLRRVAAHGRAGRLRPRGTAMLEAFRQNFRENGRVLDMSEPAEVAGDGWAEVETIGRPVKVAHQVRLEGEEAEAFAELVRRREVAAQAGGAKATNASVLRGIVRAALVAEGLLPAVVPEPKPKKKAPRR